MIKNVFPVARQDTSLVPLSARPRTLPVNSARRKDTLTQSAGRGLHKSWLTVQDPGHASTKHNISGQQLLRNGWKHWRLTFRFIACTKSNKWSWPTKASRYQIKILYYTIIIPDRNWQVQASNQACNELQRLWTEAAVLYWHVYG